MEKLNEKKLYYKSAKFTLFLISTDIWRGRRKGVTQHNLLSTIWLFLKPLIHIICFMQKLR